MNLKLVFASIIIDGLLISCVVAIPTLRRSNRAINLSFSKILALGSDFYETVKDFDKTMIDGIQLMGDLQNTAYTIGSAPYRTTIGLINMIRVALNFGLSIPGEIEGILENTILAPYYFMESMLTMFG